MDPVPAGGFIAIHRRIAEWPLYRYLRADQRHVVTTLLLLANWRPSVVWVAGRRFEVGRGELIHTEQAIAEEAGCGRQVVRTLLDLLSQDGFISTRWLTTEGTRRVRLITIRNYDRFQSGPDRENHAGNPGANHSVTTRQPEANHSVTPSEQDEQIEQGEQKRSRAEARGPLPGRFAPVRDRLVAVFAEIKKAKYGFQGTKDASAVKRLLELGDEAEIERRWRIALGVAGGYYACNSIAVFASRWNDYHAQPIPFPNGTKKLATEAPTPHERFGKGGDVAL